MLQLSSEVAPLKEKEILKWSKAEDWCEWQKGVDELKKKEKKKGDPEDLNFPSHWPNP